MTEISWQEFEKVDLQVGTIMSAEALSLVSGFVQDDAGVVLAVRDKPPNNGSKFA